MPEFILDHGTREGAAIYDYLDAFTQGYVEAMFFTDTADDLDGATLDDLAPETWARIVEDCRAFREALPRDGHGRTYLDLAYDYAPAHYDERRAGRDYWYTRNGHGTGFWDRGLGDVGDRLASAAGRHEVSLSRGDDGLLYL